MQVCKSEAKIIEHLIFYCEWTHKVWFGCDLGIRLSQQGVTSIKQWTAELLEATIDYRQAVEVLGKVASVGWTIWKTRNEAIFQQQPLNPLNAIKRATLGWGEYSFSRV